ncbi:MAG: hypothetical protein HUJ53_02665, partial [Holdemanella sp.]|nr:hypothetical protein [Holdemanella sp.]
KYDIKNLFKNNLSIKNNEEILIQNKYNKIIIQDLFKFNLSPNNNDNLAINGILKDLKAETNQKNTIESNGMR